VVEVVWAQRLLSLLVLLVLGELLLRAPLALLRAPHADPQVWCSGALLTWLGRVLARGMTRRTTPVIDLGRSWAMRFVRRALAPTLVGVVLAAWLASGVTVLDLGSRALLQRLGEAPRVLHPGLHLHLPWPFAQVRRLDYGQVHQTALASDNTPTSMMGAAPVIAAEDDPPETVDRLWERAHPAESTFLLPAPRQPGRGQALHLVNSDTRVVWRIGLEDRHAIAAGTRVLDADVLVRRLSARALTDAFQERGLDQVLASDRDRLAGVVRNVVQRDLDDLDGGIEIIGLVVDALHPPTAAAGAYHHVQAAGITAATDVLSAEAGARRRAHEAEQAASVRVLEAEAAAVEQLTKASSERVRFVADASTAQTAGAVLELERWLQGLGASLARSPLVIIDHRIPRDQVPFLDYRASPTTSVSPGDAATPVRSTP
jgi:regulator of protease activity HflC (stomatin/prohibitin superfamily)